MAELFNKLSFSVKKVLIIDDDIDFAESLGDILSLNEYEYIILQDSSTLEEVLNSFNPQVVLIDVRLGQENGINLISIIKKHCPETLCVIITAYAQIETSIKALQAGAYDYLRKPLNGEEILFTLDRCYEKIKLQYENDRSAENLRIQKRESDIRVKELNCLFTISSMLDKRNVSIDKVLSGIKFFGKV